MRRSNDWNPESYLKFADERTRPSIDLVNRIRIDFHPRNIIDIGCGPGNSGRVLAARWPKAAFLGIDNSANMIEKAKRDYPNQSWKLADASIFESAEKFDVVYSNATIQWIPHHDNLLRRFRELLSDRGVLAIQVPQFRDMPVKHAIETVANGSRWKKKMADCSSVFTYHDFGYYYDLLAGVLRTVDLWETWYLHVLESREAIIEWVRSAGLRPYLDRLDGDGEKTEFEREVLGAIGNYYPDQKNGTVIFPFKRLFMVGYR